MDNNNKSDQEPMYETKDLDVASILASGFLRPTSAGVSSLSSVSDTDLTNDSVKEMACGWSCTGGSTVSLSQGKIAEESRSLPSSSSTSLSFPEKLMKMLTWCRSEEAGPGRWAIHWCPNGKSFIIQHPANLSNYVLPKFFKACKFESFKRKLYRWGFRQVIKGPDRNAYYEENFLSYHPDRCTKLRIHYSKKEQTQQTAKALENRKKYTAKAMTLSKSPSNLAPLSHSALSPGHSLSGALALPQTLILTLHPPTRYPHPAQVLPVSHYFSGVEQGKWLGGLSDTMGIGFHLHPAAARLLHINQCSQSCMVRSGPSSEA